MFPTLTTDRLQLREIELADAEALFQIFSLHAVVEHYGMSRFTELKQAEELVHHFTNAFSSKRGIRWAITLKGDDKLIGTIGLNNLSTMHKRTEIGYELHPNYWRNGYITEALGAVEQYVFQQLQLNRIGAVVYLANDASSNMLLRNGYIEEGVLHSYMVQDGVSMDVKIFAKVKEKPVSSKSHL